MGRVAHLETQWEAKNLRRNGEKEEYAHPVSFRNLTSELQVLRRLTFDKRILDAISLVDQVCKENGLVDNQGRWRKSQRPIDELPSPDIARKASQLILMGISKREAFATVAVRCSVRAASWEAAIAQVKRAWEKGRPQIAQSESDRTGVLRNP